MLSSNTAPALEVTRHVYKDAMVLSGRCVRLPGGRTTDR
jgi:hypothetical protein